MMIEEYDGDVVEAIDTVSDGVEEGQPNIDVGQPSEAIEASIDSQDGENVPDGGEVIITIDGDEPEHESAPPWVKEVRRENREKSKRIRELEARLAEVGVASEPELGEKPTLKSCGYDDERFDAELAAWYERKRLVDEREALRRADEERKAAAWTERLNAYDREKRAIGVANYDDLEAAIDEAFSVTQKGILIQVAQSPAKLMAAIASSPARLRELAAIDDPVRFTWAASKLEEKMRIGKKAPPAERKVRPSGGAAGFDATLSRLRADAERTGDYSDVIEYLRKMREQK